MNFLYNFNNYENYFLLYIVGINLLTFLIYGLDKFKAKNRNSRIPEKILIILCLLGGSLGGLMAMVVFKHKLSKSLFYMGVPMLIIINKIIELIILNHIR